MPPSSDCGHIIVLQVKNPIQACIDHLEIIVLQVYLLINDNHKAKILVDISFVPVLEISLR
jgi:hypothetical protein